MLGEFGPLTSVQFPDPDAGALPANAVEVTLHKLWSGPALDTAGNAKMVICTSLEEEAQTPLVIVQRNIYTPAINPVTVEAGLEGVVMAGVLGPLTSVQLPVPADGAFPASVVEVTLHKLWSGPAFEIVEGA